MRILKMRWFFRCATILPFLAFGGKILGQNLVSDNVERAALLAVYNSTDGENWNGAAKWTLSQINSYPDSALHGVTVSSGDIAAINLINAGLNGSLPAALGDLTELTILRIESNSYLLGALPDLSTLTKLQIMSFSGNGLTGMIPAWLGDLIHLQQLNLASTLSGQKLSGPIPGRLGQLSALTQLNLSYNDFSQPGAIPDSLSFLDNLTSLDLQRCQLTDSSVSTGLSGLAALRSLDLSSNPAFATNNGTFPDVLYNLPNLETLSLRSMSLQKLPERFDELPMTTLTLSGNIFSDTIRLRTVIDTLKNCPSIETLNLTGCSIHALPTNMEELTTVETLYLTSNNPLDPEYCQTLGAMPALKNLYLQSCGLADIPDSLVNLGTLEALYLANNNLVNIPETIKDIPALKTLDLTNNGIEDLPSWFGTGAMISLEALTLNNNSLETLAENFSGLVNLEYLSITGNQLTGIWPADFTNLVSMKQLYLQNNQIDSLPDLSGWSVLERVNLQNNQLSGTVPAYLTQATSPKTFVNIGDNAYDSVDAAAHFSNFYAVVSVQNNRFTFVDLVPLKPLFIPSYAYAPQPTDTVDEEKEVRAYYLGMLTLVAAADTAAGPTMRYQWFKYIDGGPDVPLNTPAYAARQLTISIAQEDQGTQYYYEATNADLNQLTFVSHLQTLLIICDVVPTNVDFTSRRYLCAMNYIPLVTYPTGCRTQSYAWDLGDEETSPDKSPMHAYGSDDTYDVTMDIRYTCGICVRDTVLTKQVVYNLAEDILVDSLITVTTVKKLNVLSVSAATFSDSWPLQHRMNTTGSTGFVTGSAGVWRNEGTYVYNVPRRKSSETKIATDGTFDLDHFSWEHTDLGAIPHWIKANAMTEYSPFSYELENRDVLGVYSAALYDYSGHLPSANGVNMRNREMAFTSFEYQDMDQKSSGNWIFGTKALPAYYVYDVYSGNQNIAIVEASLEQLESVERVDVSSRSRVHSIFHFFNRYNFIVENEIVCMQPYPNNPDWAMVVLRKSPYSGLWTGKIKARNQVVPAVIPDVDTTLAHSGISSLKISAEKTFDQQLIRLDSGKAYLVNAWVSVNNLHITIPKLADNLGFEVILKDKNGTVQSAQLFEPSGKIIEGWQQIKGTFICPDNALQLAIGFKPGSTGTAWYDDLRLHPEKGNMKSYVYDLKDYRLRAILDEENFATFFYYDQEGNLYLTKKETETGIKTISENISYMRETGN